MPLIRKFSESFYLRHQRRIRRLRALRKQRELTIVNNRHNTRQANDVFLFSTVYNEVDRLPYFLKYYRDMGVNHFFFVDNASDDGSGQYLAAQPDVSLWHTNRSYKRAHFGMDWVNSLLRRYAKGHWALVVDVDEFFVYPHCDVRPINALTDWLDASGIKSLGTILIDMYPKDDPSDHTYLAGQNPFELLTHFDNGNYTFRPNQKYGNVWIQGGPRQRMFFADNPEQAPALNKTPLVKWQRGNVFISSTHTLLPRGLNNTFEEWGGEKICGALLHTKFLPDIATKAERELTRKQHYAGSREYRAYGSRKSNSTFWHEHSTEFKDWKQLENLGLISLGGWV